MKKNHILTLAFLIVSIFGYQTVAAQITITIPNFPNFPRIKKPKAEQTKQEPRTTTTDTTTTTSERQTSDENSSQTQNSEDDDEIGLGASRHLEEIEKRRKEVDEFTPERDWFVTEWTYNHLMSAVSPGERQKWFKSFGVSTMPAKHQKRFNDALDALAASAAKKLPLFVASPKTFTFRNPVEEKLMKGTLENPARYKIHKIGLSQTNWLISKNDYGLPTARYKHGMLWLRDTQSDHPYCYFTYVNIKQDYAGGGTYGASYALLVGEELAGCPANVK